MDFNIKRIFFNQKFSIPFIALINSILIPFSLIEWPASLTIINSELIIVNDAGHSMSEKGITIELIKAVKGIQNL